MNIGASLFGIIIGIVMLLPSIFFGVIVIGLLISSDYWMIGAVAGIILAIIIGYGAALMQSDKDKIRKAQLLQADEYLSQK